MTTALLLLLDAALDLDLAGIARALGSPGELEPGVVDAWD
jgi:hypothetical protein